MGARCDRGSIIMVTLLVFSNIFCILLPNLPSRPPKIYVFLDLAWGGLPLRQRSRSQTSTLSPRMVIFSAIFPRVERDRKETLASLLPPRAVLGAQFAFEVLECGPEHFQQPLMRLNAGQRRCCSSRHGLRYPSQV